MEDMTPMVPAVPVTTETYRVSGNLHHNGQLYAHGATVARSLFNDDEFDELRRAGTLKTEAEFSPAEHVQSQLDSQAAQIADLQKQLEEAQRQIAEQFPKSGDL